MSRSHFTLTVILFCIYSIAANRALAQCEIGWSNPVQYDWPVHSLRPGVDFDEDGPGPLPSLKLFAGWPGWVGGIPAEGLVGWDGTHWTRFPGGWNLPGNVESMAAIDEDGSGPLLPALFIGGSFTSIGNVAAGKVAKYSNGAWHGTLDGIPAFPFGDIRDLVALDPDGSGPVPTQLYARGSSLAVLSGNSWQLVGEASSSDFTESDILIGDLDGPGPEPISLIRCGYPGTSTSSGEVDRWTGTEWQRLGGLFHLRPTTMAMFDPDQAGPRQAELYVGGYFDTIGTKAIRVLARWRDGEWQALEKPILNSSNISRLEVGDDDGDGPRRASLFVSGSYSVPGAVPPASSNLGRWDGQDWEGLGSSAFLSISSTYLANLSIRGQLVSRWFIWSTGGNYFVRDSENWRLYYKEGPQETNVIARALDLDGAGPQSKVVVAAAKYLEPINGGVSKSIASWDGHRWQQLGTNEPGVILFKAIDVFDFDGAGPAAPSVVVAGALLFGSDRYVAAALINDTWVPLGSMSPGTGNVLAVFDEDDDGPAQPVLFLGGTGIQGPSSTAFLARWVPGIGWSPVQGSLDRAVTSLLVQDDDGAGPIRPAMYVAGPLQIDSLTVNGIGRWDGHQWSALVDVISGEVRTPNPVASLCSLEEQPGHFSLCAGGNFNTPGGLRYAARWNGGQWHPIGNSLLGAVTAMTVDDLGVDATSAARLYVVSQNALKRWTGEDWESLSNGSGQTLNSIFPIDFDGSGPMVPQMVLAGKFGAITPSNTPADAHLPAASIVLWGPRQPFFFATPWNRSIAACDRLSLKVATGGPEPMTFAWTRDGVVVNDGGAVSGATTRELVINPVAFGDSGQYECIATNACGSIPSGPTLVQVCAALATGDLNADGHVDGLDISPFVAQWTSPSSPESDCAVDLTHNGVRDPDDLAWFIGRLLSP